MSGFLPGAPTSSRHDEDEETLVRQGFSRAEAQRRVAQARRQAAEQAEQEREAARRAAATAAQLAQAERGRTVQATIARWRNVFAELEAASRAAENARAQALGVGAVEAAIAAQQRIIAVRELRAVAEPLCRVETGRLTW